VNYIRSITILQGINFVLLTVCEDDITTRTISLSMMMASNMEDTFTDDDVDADAVSFN